ncbi:hypothetical protein VKT23_020030 [Stygiomarasmius scandens]|uniref:Uncharacterized protein n=1 Tax=Marasmiellus scandens TaxID=2682957 RepID=A0ABR1IJX4_9AGAR
MDIDDATRYFEGLHAQREERKTQAAKLLKSMKSPRRDELTGAIKRIDEFECHVDVQIAELQDLHSSRLTPWLRCREELAEWTANIGLVLQVTASPSQEANTEALVTQLSQAYRTRPQKKRRISGRLCDVSEAVRRGTLVANALLNVCPCYSKST